MIGNLVVFLGGVLAGAILFPRPKIAKCIWDKVWRLFQSWNSRS